MALTDIKRGSRVRALMVSTKTPGEERKDRHNDVKGTLVLDLKVGGMIAIAPETADDSPRGLATSAIHEITEVDDGSLMVQTNNTLYKLNRLDESRAG